MTSSNPFSSKALGFLQPEHLSALQADFFQSCQALHEQAQQGTLPALQDRRFADPAWQKQPMALWQAHMWELTQRLLRQYIDKLELDNAERERIDFAAMQWIEAMAPSNFLCSNPQAWDTLLATQGQSLLQGARNFLDDVQKGRLSQSDESQFFLGDNLANTPGAVIYQNELIQLIQYKPTTEKQYSLPLLIVPPCINKFYILDLQPQNSLVRYALDQGIAVYLISWRNPACQQSKAMHQATWGDYLEHGVLQAIDVVRAVSQQEKINTLGFCIGGTLLACALALAKTQGDDPASSMTLLTSMLNFSDTGILNVFIDEAHVQLREWQAAQGSILHAAELAATFSFLRPSELVWNYVSSNYLEGKTPSAFDLLYWNSDGTHLPGAFFAWYLRHTYLQNSLVQPGGVQINGHQVDISQLSMPVYVYGSRDDHIVPWVSAYASLAALPKAQHRFVLGASGHIAGVVNPPVRKRRHYWTADQAAQALSASQWLEQAQRHDGSWWPDWMAWLQSRSGVQQTSVTQLGNHQFTELEAAPGSYVQVRAV